LSDSPTIKTKRIKPLEKRIAKRIGRMKADVFVRDNFKDLGGYDQVRRALRRLAEKGQLVKIGYGLYARAMVSPLSGKAIPKKPLPTLAAEALDRLDVETAPSSFDQAYNADATTQVPTGRVIVVRSRISRKIGYDGKYIIFERA